MNLMNRLPIVVSIAQLLMAINDFTFNVDANKKVIKIVQKNPKLLVSNVLGFNAAFSFYFFVLIFCKILDKFYITIN